MLQLEYNEFTENFLIKQFNNITINITINNNQITAITGYNEQQDLVDIPDEIIKVVKNDINNCNE